MKKLLALSVLGLTACGTGLKVQWVDPEILKGTSAKDFSRAPAVVLFLEDHALLSADPSDSHSQISEHKVTLIQSEAGKAFGEARLAIPPKAKVIALQARVVQPDGTVIEIPKEQILDQLSETKERGFGAKVFRFPDVRVGSKLEYVYVYEIASLYNAVSRHPEDKLPIVRYEAAVTYNRLISPDPQVHNAKGSFETHEDDYFYRTTRWVAHDLPVRDEALDAPGWALAEPWWVFRVSAITIQGHSFDWLRSWYGAMQPWAKVIYGSDKLYAGYTPLLTGDCRDKRCWIDWALANVRDTTDWDGFGEFDKIRPLQQVVEGGRATSFEKATLLRKLLDSVGVTAKLAGAARIHTFPELMENPATYGFDDLLVYVPQQDGLETPLWLDPTCEYCAVGELPVWTRDVTAIPFFRSPQNQYEAEVGTAHGKEPAIQDTVVETVNATVGVNGDVTGNATDVASGVHALLQAARHHGEKKEAWKKSAQGEVSLRSTAGQLDGFTVGAYEKAKGTYQSGVDFTLPAFATVDGDRLLVPLGLFSKAFTALANPKRTTDIAFTQPEGREELLTLRPPPGYVLAEGPKGWQKSAGKMVAELEVKPIDGGITVRRRASFPDGVFHGDDVKTIAELARAFGEVRDQVVVFKKQSP